jgi:hypothetical protein
VVYAEGGVCQAVELFLGQGIAETSTNNDGHVGIESQKLGGRRRHEEA